MKWTHLNIVLIASLIVGLSSCGEKKSSIRINEVMCNNLNYTTDKDYFQYADWIELYNSGDDAQDLTGYVLSDKNKADGWTIPPGTVIGPKEYRVFWADGVNKKNHTNFKIKNKGETIFLFDSNHQLIDSLVLIKQKADVSFGIGANGQKGYFVNPTPNKKNEKAYSDLDENIPEPIFEKGSQLVSKGHEVALKSISSEYTMRYTLDCSVPTLNSQEYISPIIIDSTTVIRARCFNKDGIPGMIVTQSFIVDPTNDLPVLSLVTDPKNLWDDYIGIYTEGKNGLPGEIGPVANWNRDWERLANFEYFEQSDTARVNLLAGIKILGLYISAWPQKPFGIYFRKQYGKSKVKYPFFQEKDIDEYSHLVIRVADWNDTGIRDGMMTSLVAGKMDIDYQGYRPVVTYLNGKYWGIYNMREKQNENYLKANHHVDPKKVDLIEYKIGQLNVIEGSGDDYQKMLDFCQSNPLNDPANYQTVIDQIDLNNYLDYYIAQLYFANSDWPGNNLKCWKSQEPGSKWRWVLYDLDNGFDFYHRRFDQFNSIAHAITTEGDAHHNPAHSTLLFRSLVNNQQFAQQFLQRFALHLNTTLSTKRVHHVIDSISGNVLPSMPQQVDKWGDIPISGYHSYKSLEEWKKNVNYLKTFAKNRHSFVWQMLKGIFSVNETVNLTVRENKGGIVNVVGVDIKKTYIGQHFKNVPMVLKAVPNEGYEFVGWEGDPRKDPNIQIVPTKPIVLKPIFKKE